MTDLDDAVGSIARVEASPGFAASVRARIDADGTSRAPMWPRLAAGAAGLAAIAVTLWFAAARPEAPATEMASQSSPTSEAVAPARSEPVAALTPPMPTASRPVPRARRRTAPRLERDHDRALAALAAPDALDVPGIDPPPLDVSAMAIPSLDRPATLSVLDIPAGGAGIGDRR